MNQGGPEGPNGLDDLNTLLILLFGMMFAAISWLAQTLKAWVVEQPTPYIHIFGGLIGALMLGFTVAALMAEYTGVPPAIVWTACILAGFLGEKAAYAIIARTIGSRFDITIDTGGPREDEQEVKK